jgi:hypothetical protein
MKRFALGLAILTLTFASLAAAQGNGSILPKSSRDPLQNVNKPLTPKSALPTPRPITSIDSKVVTGTRDPRVELDKIEQQQQQITVKSKTLAQPAVRYRPAIPETAGKTGSGLNAPYRKPVANKN